MNRFLVNDDLKAEGVSPIEYSFYIIGHNISIIAFITHLIFLAIFYWLGITELVLFNIISCVIYVISYILTHKGYYNIVLFSIISEIILHGVLAVYYLGWETGFHYYIIAIIPIIFFSALKNKSSKVLLSLFVGAIYSSLIYYSSQIDTVYLLDEYIINNFKYMNVISLFMIIIIPTYFYNQAIIKTREELEEYSSELEKKNKKLTDLKNRLELAIEGANLGLWDWNIKDNQIFFNENWAQILGYELDEIEQSMKAWQSRVHEEDKRKATRKFKRHLMGKTEYFQSEHRLKTKSGDWKWIKALGEVVKRDEKDAPLRIVGVYLDIDDKKRAKEKAEYLAFHDELTGIYNRRYFENEKNRLNNSRKLPISIIIGDIDELKYINDNYGHKRGDMYIQRAAEIFDEVTREEDVVARIGGDEFAILLPNTDANIAKKICARYYDKLRRTNVKTEFPENLSISLGFATMESRREDLDAIFQKADNSMYVKKKGSRN